MESEVFEDCSIFSSDILALEDGVGVAKRDEGASTEIGVTVSSPLVVERGAIL